MLRYNKWGDFVIVCNDLFQNELDKEFIKLLKEEFKMSEFKNYKRKQIAELREITEQDIKHYEDNGVLYTFDTEEVHEVSISDVDFKDGSPKVGDMVARNPKNHNDQWLVAKKYFEDNFEEC